MQIKRQSKVLANSELLVRILDRHFKRVNNRTIDILIIVGVQRKIENMLALQPNNKRQLDKLYASKQYKLDRLKIDSSHPFIDFN